MKNYVLSFFFCFGKLFCFGNFFAQINFYGESFVDKNTGLLSVGEGEKVAKPLNTLIN